MWDLDRPAAIARCRRALAELVIEGVRTTRELAIDIMQSESFVTGSYSTSFLDDAGAAPCAGGAMIEVARTPLGRISLEPKALEQLVRFAAEEVDGARVAGRHALDVSLGDDGAAIGLVVRSTAPRGAVLPELGKRPDTDLRSPRRDAGRPTVPYRRADRAARGGSRLMPGGAQPGARRSSSCTSGISPGSR